MARTTILDNRRELAQLLGVHVPEFLHGVHISDQRTGELLSTLHTLVQDFGASHALALENNRLGRENDRLRFATGEFARTAEQQAHWESKAEHRANYAHVRATPVEIPVHVIREKLKATYRSEGK